MSLAGLEHTKGDYDRQAKRYYGAALLKVPELQNTLEIQFIYTSRRGWSNYCPQAGCGLEAK